MVVSREKGVLDSKSKSNLLPAQLAPTLRNFLSTLVWRRWRRWTLPVQAWLFHAITHDPNSPPKPYLTESLPNLNAAVGLSLLETLDENIDARRARVRAYRELLGGETRLTLIPHRPGSPCLTQIVRVLPRHSGDDLSAHLIGALGRAGYEVQGSYVPIHLLPYSKTWVRKRLPRAERVWSDLIELPCEPEVSFVHVEGIAAIVKRVLRDYSFCRSLYREGSGDR
jgi:hypothetical protein